MDLTTKPFGNGWTQVGVARVPACPGRLPDGNYSGVLLKAPGSNDLVPNTVPVHIGGWAVTADEDPSTGGFPLAPGESMTLPLKDVEELYVIATSSSQLLAWFLV